MPIFIFHYISFCIGASIHISREIRCLPYAGFLMVWTLYRHEGISDYEVIFLRGYEWNHPITNTTNTANKSNTANAANTANTAIIANTAHKVNTASQSMKAIKIILFLIILTWLFATNAILLFFVFLCHN